MPGIAGRRKGEGGSFRNGCELVIDRFFDRRVLLVGRFAFHSGEKWAPLASALVRMIAERMMKRVVTLLREARHGGTIVFVPMDNAQDRSRSTDNVSIDLKYRFHDGQPPHSFPDLVVDILNRLAQIHGLDQPRCQPVTWEEFEAATDDEIASLDEALFEMAHLIAGLAAADGAVVLNQQHDLLGFGGMISGNFPPSAPSLGARS